MPEIASLAEEMKLIFENDAWHGPGLRAILEGVTAEKAAARPASGGHSIWELVQHIFAWEDVFRRRLLGVQMDEPEGGDFPPVVGDHTSEAWAATVRQLYTEHDRFTATVSAIPDAALDLTVVGKPYSLRYMIRGAIRHAVYHSGQIALLKK